MSEKAVIKIHPLPHSDSPIKKEVGQLSLDIFQTPKEIVILAPIAGVAKEDIHLSLTEDVLVIKGERKLHEVIDEDSYYTKECFWGLFQRSIVLPLEADTKHISASFDLNVLEIRIPKTERESTQIIKIKSNED
ncbi:Hsp20/alpha crystallin family protein [Candidatus Peregrinibacteria bacterium CG10_big_fil_rev_8_21_14_0_10_36_19]|nr:MAG: Hsp20/alpha crystallin family protein [Candidatus Peregrinibacteria bacterium CG10_big_fil_rev_8_21_14_0_10_36_19]